MDQNALGLVLGSNKFFATFEEYLFLKLTINEIS